MNNLLQFGGIFRWERRSPRGLLLSKGTFRNGICLPGINDVLSAAFVQGTQRTWRAGLIDLNGFAALSNADTMVSHAGWVESTAYSGSRPLWNPSAPASQKVNNAALFTFAMTGNATIHGLFITSDSTKGGTAGILWATGIGDVDQQMSSGETLSCGYDLTGAAGVGS